MSLLLRVAKRKASWDDIENEESLRAEFGVEGGLLDLSLSVYEVNEKERSLQVSAEHQAGSGLNPKGQPCYDFSGAKIVQETLGETGFEFTQNAHREIKFENDGDLKAFIKQLAKNLRSHHFPVEKKHIREYSKGRIEKEDPEWLEFCSRQNSQSMLRDWKCPNGC